MDVCIVSENEAGTRLMQLRWPFQDVAGDEGAMAADTRAAAHLTTVGPLCLCENAKPSLCSASSNMLLEEVRVSLDGPVCRREYCRRFACHRHK
jgi:hypothetical protein